MFRSYRKLMCCVKRSISNIFPYGRRAQYYEEYGTKIAALYILPNLIRTIGRCGYDCILFTVTPNVLSKLWIKFTKTTRANAAQITRFRSTHNLCDLRTFSSTFCCIISLMLRNSQCFGNQLSWTVMKEKATIRCHKFAWWYLNNWAKFRQIWLSEKSYLY